MARSQCQITVISVFSSLISSQPTPIATLRITLLSKTQQHQMGLPALIILLPMMVKMTVISEIFLPHSF
jgi:hypothetical protein